MKKTIIVTLLAFHSTAIFADMMPGLLPGKPYTIPLPETEKETAAIKSETEPDSNASQAAPKTYATPANEKIEKLEALVQQQTKTISELQEKVDSLEKNLALEKAKNNK